jgi:hypothetical protein
MRIIPTRAPGGLVQAATHQTKTKGGTKLKENGKEKGTVKSMIPRVTASSAVKLVKKMLLCIIRISNSRMAAKPFMKARKSNSK